MGNSPSQQTTEGAQGEPDDFDLNAISDGPGDDEMPPKMKKNLAPQVDSRSRTGTRTRSRTSSTSTAKSSAVDLVPLRMPQTTKDVRELLEDYDYPPAPVQDTKMQNPDETSSDETSSEAISMAPPSPGLQPPVTGGIKRKRGSFIMEEAPVAKPKKRRTEKSSPPTSMEPAEKALGQINTTTTKSTSKQSGLQALERDAGLISRETSPQPRPSLQFPLPSNALENEHGAEEDELPRRRNMATSVAKRTFPFVIKKAGSSSRNLHDEPDYLDYASEQDHQSEDEYFGDLGADIARTTPTPWPATKPKPKRLAVAQKPGSALNRPSRATQSARKGSEPDFDVEASDNAGNTSRPSRREKKKCAECEEIFKSRKLLKEHEQETRHAIDTVRTKATGRFSDYENQKLAKYKADFCRIYDITGHQFNDMMTDSCRRGAGQVWPYDIISKQDFLMEYFDVLPERNRKSLARFRERNWQNATGSKDWTTEDDDQIVKLVEEIGTKWVEIGQALTRTQDAVQQRWKKHLQYRDTKKDGKWSPEENEKLARSVAGAKRRGGLSQDASTDERITWSIVSDALNGSRTPKQCADHWQFLQESADIQQARKEGKGRTSKKHGKRLSSMYVDDSDSEIEGKSRNQVLSKNTEEIRELINGVPEVPAGTPSDLEAKRPQTKDFVKQTEDGEFMSATKSRRPSKYKQTRRPLLASETIEDEKQSSQRPASPELPPSLRKKTPSKVTTLSQAFANTQANTSSLRRTQRHLPTPMSDRPSPSLLMQVKHPSPTIEETSVDTDEIENSEETQEAVVIEDPSAFQSTASRTTRAGDKPVSGTSDSESEDESEDESESESKSESDEDEGVFGMSKKLQGPPSAEKASGYYNLEHEAMPAKEETDSDNDLKPLPKMPIRVGSMEAKGSLVNEEETSSEDESDDEEDSSDEETTSASDDDTESDDSMVEETRNDFMESIKKTAEKAELAKQQKRSQIVRPVLHDSDSESESDAESIEHG